MFDYYFATIFFAIFIMIIIAIMVYSNEMLDKKKKLQFGIAAILVIIAAISEWLGVFLDGKADWTHPFHILVKTTELSVASFIPVICADILSRLKHTKIIYGILGFQVILEIISAFTGFIFYVDDSNVYHHGTFYPVYIISFLIGIVLFSYKVFYESHRQYGMHKVLLLLLPLLAICGLGFQYMDDGIRVIWLCSAIDLALMYIMYLELAFNTDALTHLLNRSYYESRINRLRESASIFYIDVNDFKTINDTYGHAYGDVALTEIANSIQAAFGNNGYCYRIGGDEFAVIANIPAASAETFIESFYHHLRHKQKKNKHLPSASIGYAFFDPKEDRPISEVIDEADAMMYENKRKSKEVTS